MKQGRILIVEDERSMVDALPASLKENGYDATATNSNVKTGTTFLVKLPAAFAKTDPQSIF